MVVDITSKNIQELNAFMLVHSKMAKKQKFISFYLVPFEFMVVGIGIDFFLKTAPICSLVSIVLSGIWLYFFPKYYKKTIKKYLLKNAHTKFENLKMNFEVNDNEILFFKDTPGAKDKFLISNLSKIVKFKDIYILIFNHKVHIVLPQNPQIEQVLSKLPKSINQE